MENRESTFLPGEAFGPYVIVRLLGKGGMGEVFKASACGRKTIPGR